MYIKNLSAHLSVKGHSNFTAQLLRRGLFQVIAVLAFTAQLLITGNSALAVPTTASQAKQVVKAWLQSDGAPLGAELGHEIKKVTKYKNTEGRVIFYVVSLAPRGMVFVSGDDLVEPIVGFSTGKKFSAKKDNPLGALVTSDLRARVTEAATLTKLGSNMGASRFSTAQSKWKQLAQSGQPGSVAQAGLSSVSDPRVDPIVQSSWDQGKDNANVNYLYNYYAPNHYWSGCVATAMAQLMRYHQYPTSGVGTAAKTVYVGGVATTTHLRGGNDAGGAYDWSLMPLNPSGYSLTNAERLQIGRLLADAGSAVKMMYGANGSGAYMTDATSALKSTFFYSSAKWLYNSNTNIPAASLAAAVQTNLNAGYPVLLAITGALGGHAIVSDGYGYNSSTLYHHLNLGWGGYDNAWYNLPTIRGGFANFNSVVEVIYNIFPSGSGEIISGRIVDSLGSPIAGVSVAAGSLSATTNSRGIYAIKNVPSATTYVLNVTKTGYTFVNRSVTTGTSKDFSYSGVPGNIIADFTGTAAVIPVAPSITSQPSSQTVNAGKSVTFAVSATGTATLSYQWTRNGTNISGATASSYSISKVAAGDAGAVFAVTVANSAGSATSNNATLSVNVAPTITTHPVGQSILTTGSAELTVEATGTAPLYYQWYRAGKAISGATNASYSPPASLSNNNIKYTVAVKNMVGSVTSNAATLKVALPKYVISGQVTVDGEGLAGAVVSAGKLGSATTDSDGNYTLPGITSGTSYKITATHAGYTLTPSSTNSGKIAGDGTLNFTGTIKLFTISGTVYLKKSTLRNVTISGGDLGDQITNSKGYFKFSNVPYGTVYTLTPSLTGYNIPEVSGTLSANKSVTLSATKASASPH